jgi:hypothetical protein
MFAPGLQKLKLSFIEGLDRILLSSEPPENGDPTAEHVVAQANVVKHPFAPD